MSKPCQRVLKVDIDIPYQVFRGWLPFYNRVVDYAMNMLGYVVLMVKTFPSKNGNTHVYVYLDRCVEPERYHLVMFLLHDDHKRIRHSLSRYIKTGVILDFFYEPWDRRQELWGGGEEEREEKKECRE